MNEELKNLLRELEKTAKEFWNISPETGDFLNLLIKDRNYKIALEIGTSNGYSGIWLAEALSQTSGHLYTIESHYKKRFHLAEANFEKSGLSNYITQILGHAPEAIPTEPKTFDFAFFDATKMEHTDYFNALKNRIEKGGTIVTDNIISHSDEFTEYITQVKAEPGWNSVILNIGTGLMIATKTL